MNEEQKYALDTAFVIAAARGEKDIVKCLLKAGADIHTNHDAALVRAAEEGHIETVQFLLFMGADPQGDKTLLRAAQHGHKEALRVLLDWADSHPPASGTSSPQGPSL